MSIREWLTPGQWIVNNASIAISTDDGNNFNKIGNISWNGNSNFVEFAVAQDLNNFSNGFVYLLATSAGRFGDCYLCRVPVGQVLNQTAYQYFFGLDSVQNPIWLSNITQISTIFSGPIRESSCMWNNYLGKWMVMYLQSDLGAIVIRTASNLWGPWSDPTVIVDNQHYPSLYGGYINPYFVKNNGQFVYFTMSLYSDYNVFLMQVDLSSLKVSN